MRAPVLVLPAFAALLAGCDLTPTAPHTHHRLQVPVKPDRAIMLASGWSLVSLPFVPYAINDAGVIVGYQNHQAVRWENGTLTILPGIVGLTNYIATSISPNGTIAGIADNHVVLWKSPSSTPVDISGAVSNPYGALVNDNQVVAFNTREKVGTYWVDRPWESLPSFLGMRRTLPLPSGTYSGEVTGLNGNGYTSGWEWTDSAEVHSRLPVRWDPNRGLTMLPFIQTGGFTSGISAAGNIVGNAQTVCPDGVNDYCVSTVMVWRLDGTIQELFDAPMDFTAGISNVGRIIGNSSRPWTYFDGVVAYPSYPDDTPPVLTAVNACGSIVGRKRDFSAGYLWKHSTCDIVPIRTGTL